MLGKRSHQVLAVCTRQLEHLRLGPAHQLANRGDLTDSCGFQNLEDCPADDQLYHRDALILDECHQLLDGEVLQVTKRCSEFEPAIVAGPLDLSERLALLDGHTWATWAFNGMTRREIAPSCFASWCHGYFGFWMR